MPLHDWTDRPGWDGVHLLWITELLRWVKPRLPEGYRAYVGTAPTLAVGAPPDRPMIGVHQLPADSTAPPPNGAESTGRLSEEPDEEIAVSTLDLATALYVESKGCLIATVESISPRNKGRIAAQATYLGRYAGYLAGGIHLLLVDVHRRPLNSSFAVFPEGDSSKSAEGSKLGRA